MLKAYCDSSMKVKDLAVTAIVVTPKTFIDYELRLLPWIKWSAQGELHAMLLAMELVNRNFDTPQDVTVYSDCQSMVEQFASSLKTGKVPYNRVYRQDWLKLMDACAMHKVKAKYIRGHAHGRTFHTICDYSARAMI